MKGIVADENCAGHLERIVQIVLLSPEWIELWNSLSIRVMAMEEIGLSEQSPDDRVWAACQERDLVLVTANRNHDGPDSLEAVIRRSPAANSLPVITFANATRVIVDAEYARMVGIKLLDYLLNIDDYRGVGRLFVP